MRRTRSSTRREAEESGDEDVPEEDYALVQGAAPRPPPPPPPPPRRRAQNINNTSTSESVTARPIAPQDFKSWTLVLLTPSGNIRIAITSNMTPVTLGQCIWQATHGYDSIDPDMMETPVAGLFCDRSNVFMSLEHILSTSPQDHGGVFSLHKKQPPPFTPWYLQYHWMALLIILATWCLYTYSNIVWHSVSTAWSTILDTVVTIPLQEFYRNAPAFLGGWEGQSLASICARITFHGDEVFWRSNLDECQRIFSYKEEHYLKLTKPIIYLLFIIGIIQVIRMLVREHALHRRPTQNREMVETYHAFQILLRQFKRQQHQHHYKDK